MAFDNFRLYYSYKTIVAFYDHVGGLVCSGNKWGTTIGKHLNWIQPDKKKRISHEEFEAKLQEMLEWRTK